MSYDDSWELVGWSDLQKRISWIVHEWMYYDDLSAENEKKLYQKFSQYDVFQLMVKAIEDHRWAVVKDQSKAIRYYRIKYETYLYELSQIENLEVAI
jgi:hypothetical protein